VGRPSGTFALRFCKLGNRNQYFSGVEEKRAKKPGLRNVSREVGKSFEENKTHVPGASKYHERGKDQTKLPDRRSRGKTMGDRGGGRGEGWGGEFDKKREMIGRTEGGDSGTECIL